MSSLETNSIASTSTTASTTTGNTTSTIATATPAVVQNSTDGDLKLNTIEGEAALAVATTSANEKMEQQRQPQQQQKILQATASMCYHCFDVIVDELLGNHNNNNDINKRGYTNQRLKFLSGSSSSGSGSSNSTHKIPDFVNSLPDPNISCPLFVTWDKSRNNSSSTNNIRNDNEQHYDLRGCIGTLSPKPIIMSIGEYAISSAFRDKRFHPIAWKELPFLRVAVSLLVQYEECTNVYDWVIGIHGILIRFTVGNINATNDVSSSLSSTIANAIGGSNNNIIEREYSATYLPEVAPEQGWDHTTTITSLIKKAGYNGPITKDFLLSKNIRCTRYQSSKYRTTFQQYMEYRGYNNNNDYSNKNEQPQRRHKQKNDSQYHHQQQMMLLKNMNASASATTANNNSRTDTDDYRHQINNNIDMLMDDTEQQHHKRWNTCNNL